MGVLSQILYESQNQQGNAIPTMQSTLSEPQDEGVVDFGIHDDTLMSSHDFDSLDLHFNNPADESARLAQDLEEYFQNKGNSDIDSLSDDIPDEHSDTSQEDLQQAIHRKLILLIILISH